ncbi:hypothetical protein QC763_0114740 [Podospora pseudopauciseta]|uniref:Uncharacterized protein n=1 Tax=Podospora pseudopauciseta TaxID=2093780 RepID=A0ABR0GZT1_9PEZI|nr:hypothetical protein QC763_0114740 [Podospora pseudopauciseta]
MHCAYVSRL